MNKLFKACKGKLGKFLNKVLGSGADNFAQPLLKAAGCISYVETVCRKKADSLHLKIKRSYEEDIAESYISLLRSTFPKLKKATIAIDITDESFYSKYSSLHIHNWTGEKGVQGLFKYIVLNIIDKEKVPVMALPFPVGGEKADFIEKLIGYAREICRDISLVLLDRGFYSGSVIQKLQDLEVPYLIFVPKNEAVKRYIDEGLDTVEHTIKYKGDRTLAKVTTTLVLIEYEEKNWCFATNVQLNEAVHYIIKYKKRWQIETDFRVQDEAKIKSKSRFYIIRYFYFMISMLLHMLWRRIKNMPFKAFVIEFEKFLFFISLNLDYAYPS